MWSCVLGQYQIAPKNHGGMMFPTRLWQSGFWRLTGWPGAWKHLHSASIGKTCSEWIVSIQELSRSVLQHATLPQPRHHHGLGLPWCFVLRTSGKTVLLSTGKVPVVGGNMHRCQCFMLLLATGRGKSVALLVPLNMAKCQQVLERFLPM